MGGMVPPAGAGPRGASLLDMKALRCSSCGAPLKEPVSGDLVACDHCGTVQKIVDARAFLDQIMLQVNAFVRTALPYGVDAAASSVIDPVARHSLWVGSVGPRLATEYSETRFKAFNLLSQPLAVLPFTVLPQRAGLGDPKEAFLFQAKVQSVSTLAVDDESKQTVSESTGLAVAYAYALTNAGLLRSDKPERYHLMSQNFTEASKALHDVAKLRSIELRFAGLGELSRALDLLTQGRTNDARKALENAETSLSEARQIMAGDFDQAVMIQAADEETSLVRATRAFGEAVALDPQGASAGSLLAFRYLLLSLRAHRDTTDPIWQRTFSAPDRQEKLLAMARDARRAQAGGSGVKVAPTSGPLAVPFWVIEAPYSFQTGAAWRKHAVEVAEAMLVAGTFPADPMAMNLSDPARVLTDVFSARERAGLMARVGGRETAISGGGPVRGMLQASAPRSLRGLKVIPPLSTPDDALMLVQGYIDKTRRTDPTIDKQLKLSSPRVVDLVYVPTQLTTPGYPVIPGLAALSPRSAGDPGALQALAL